MRRRVVRPGAPHRIHEGQEGRREDLGARQRRERSASRRDLERQAHDVPARGRDDDRIAAYLAACGAGITAQHDGHRVAAIERWLGHAHFPAIRRASLSDARLQPVPHRVERGRAQRRQVLQLSGRGKRREGVDEALELGDDVRRIPEWRAMASVILEVALDAHRAEHEPAQRECGGVARDVIGEDARAPAARDEGACAPPAQGSGGAIGVACTHSDAGVLGVCQEVHQAPLSPVEVDLEGVAGGVPKDPCLVALVGGAVVEPGVGEGEDGGDGAGRGGELGGQQDRAQEHMRAFGGSPAAVYNY